MEEEEKGISIGEIFKVIFKRVWWVVGVTAAVMIIFVCLIQFWYNPSRQTYSASFDIRLPSGNSYPDGTELKLEDSVLLESLQLIKDDELLPEDKRTGQFESVDIEKMVSEDGVQFLQTVERQEDETYAYHNTVRIGKKYFKNEKQGVAFVRAVVEFPVANSLYIVNGMNYSERLALYDAYLTYDEKINALTEQKNYILQKYEDIRTQYSGEYAPKGLDSEKMIDDYIREMTDIFDARQQEAIKDTISANYLVFDTETYKNTAQAKMDSLKISIDENEKRIVAQRAERDRLLQNNNIMEATEYDKIIADLTDKNAVMLNEWNKTKETFDKIDSPEYVSAKSALDARLNEIRAKLETATATMRTVNIATYAEKAQAIYVNNKIEVNGGLSVILAALIGLVGGFVLVSIVILIIDLPKYKRKKLAAQTVGEVTDERSDGEEKE